MKTQYGRTVVYDSSMIRIWTLEAGEWRLVDQAALTITALDTAALRRIQGYKPIVVTLDGKAPRESSSFNVMYLDEARQRWDDIIANKTYTS